MRYERFLVRSIGYVENDFSVPAAPEPIRADKSRIVLDPTLTQGLRGLEAGSQILVVFYFHRSSGNSLLQYPRGDRSLPRRGVFALRSPNRPNPIGVTIVDLLAVEDNVLLVRGLDAIDGTPVLDIKPALNSVIELAQLLVRAQARAVSRLNSTSPGLKRTKEAEGHLNTHVQPYRLYPSTHRPLPAHNRRTGGRGGHSQLSNARSTTPQS